MLLRRVGSLGRLAAAAANRRAIPCRVAVPGPGWGTNGDGGGVFLGRSFGSASSSVSRRRGSAAAPPVVFEEADSDWADPEEPAVNPFDFGFPADRDDQGLENREDGGPAGRRRSLGQFAELAPLMQGHKVWKEAEERAARVRKDEFIAPTTARTAKELRLLQAQKRKTKAAATRSSVAQHKDYAQEVLNRLVHSFTKPIRRCLKSFPKLQDLHPFDLAITELNLDQGIAEYVQTQDAARRLCNFADNLHKKHLRLCRAALTDKGVLDRLRASTAEIRAQIKPRLILVDELRELRHKLRSQHVIDPERPTAVLVGAPNVGKSSLVRAVSTGTPEVQNYSFTTRSLNVGHIHPPSASQMIYLGLRRREESVAQATAGLEFPRAAAPEPAASGAADPALDGDYGPDGEDPTLFAEDPEADLRGFVESYERLARGETSAAAAAAGTAGPPRDPRNPLRTPEEAAAAREQDRMLGPLDLPDAGPAAGQARAAGVGLGPLLESLEEDRRRKEARRQQRELARVAAGGRSRAQKERAGHKPGVPNAYVVEGKPSGWGRAGGGSSGVPHPHEIIQVTDTPGLLYRPLQAAAARAFGGQAHPEEEEDEEGEAAAVTGQTQSGFVERYLADYDEREARRNHRQGDGGDGDHGADPDPDADLEYYDPELSGPAVIERFGLRAGMYDEGDATAAETQAEADPEGSAAGLAWSGDSGAADVGIFNDPYEWLSSQHQAIEREEEAMVKPPQPITETLRAKLEARRERLAAEAGSGPAPVLPRLPELRFNRIEQLTLTSLEYLRRPLVVFVLDASGESGYSLAYQLLVRRYLRHLFPELPWLDVLSKTDLLPAADHPDHADAVAAAEAAAGRHFWSADPELARQEEEMIAAALAEFWGTEPPEPTVNTRLAQQPAGSGRNPEALADWSRSWTPAMHAMLDGERETLLREMGLPGLPRELQMLMPPGVFWVSSKDNHGIDELKALIVESLCM